MRVTNVFTEEWGHAINVENNPDHVFYISCHTFCVGYTNQKTADVVIGGWWDLCHTFSAYQKRDSMGTLFIRGGSRLYFFNDK